MVAPLLLLPLSLRSGWARGDANESADNGQYPIWGVQNLKHEWWKSVATIPMPLGPIGRFKPTILTQRLLGAAKKKNHAKRVIDLTVDLGQSTG